MTKQESVVVGEAWLSLAQIYGKELQAPALKIILHAISDLDKNAVMAALGKWAAVSKQGRHPYPIEIREMVNPTIDEDSIARETASRVMSAVRQFGYTRPTEAKVYIGDLGWRIVARYGGWQTLCDELGVSLDVGTFQAQVRDLAKSLRQFAKAGELDQAPSLSSSPDPQIMSIVKRLTESNSIPPEEEF